jgi:hypothetical protein
MDAARLHFPQQFIHLFRFRDKIRRPQERPDAERRRLIELGAQ